MKNEIAKAIEEYIITALKNPMNPGYDVKIVPELIRALRSVAYLD